MGGFFEDVGCACCSVIYPVARSTKLKQETAMRPGVILYQADQRAPPIEGLTMTDFLAAERHDYKVPLKYV